MYSRGVRVNGKFEKPEQLKDRMGESVSSDNADILKLQMLLKLADGKLLENYSRKLNQLESLEKSRKSCLSKRRSEMEIFASILQISGEGVNKTRILYHANLSYVQLKNYLAFLMNGGFLEERRTRHGEKIYCTTRKGHLFINRWDEITCMVYEGGII